MAKKNPVFVQLESIMNDVGLPYFLMSVSHLMDVGYRHQTEENVKAAIDSINKQDDSSSFMSNGFQVMLVETAFKISRAAQPLDLAKFVSKHIA